MIERKNVITIKLPFPNINSGLAVKPHMYICYGTEGKMFNFIKCQRIKPKMIFSNKFRHYIDELPDIKRNPFVYPTRIDCDKMFMTEDVCYDDKLKTSIRPDISDDLMLEIDSELLCDGYTTYRIRTNDLLQLNPLAHRI